MSNPTTVLLPSGSTPLPAETNWKWTENRFIAGLALGILSTVVTAAFGAYVWLSSMDHRLSNLEKADISAVSAKVIELDQRLKRQEEFGVVGQAVQNEINRLWDDLNETEGTLETLRENVTSTRERLARVEGRTESSSK